MRLRIRTWLKARPAWLQAVVGLVLFPLAIAYLAVKWGVVVPCALLGGWTLHVLFPPPPEPPTATE